MSREIMEIAFRLFTFGLFIYVFYVLLFLLTSFRFNENEAHPKCFDNIWTFRQTMSWLASVPLNRRQYKLLFKKQKQQDYDALIHPIII